ncbi:cytochrome c biogenesis heme-transporting ATPase CcmA [Sessilibacter sp. MAH4]
MGLKLELHNIQCERDDRILFSGLNAVFSAGEVIQIEGPNGSGKTTLLRVLTTLSSDYSGDILFNEQPFSQAKFEFLSNLLFLGHAPGVKKSLTPLENLLWYQRAAGVVSKENLMNALAAVGLAGYEDVACFQLSAGQQRRVALARLYFDPSPLWILDEPFTAIDKKGVTALEALIEKRALAGGIVILTTHQDMAFEGLRKIDLRDYRTQTTMACEAAQ